MKKRRRGESFMFVFMILLLVALFSSMLETINPFLGYIDEVIVFAFIAAAFIKMLFLERQQVKSLDGWMITAFVFCSVFLIVAFIPNLYAGAHSTLLMQVYTFFGITKFLLVFFCGRILLQNTRFITTIPWMKKVSWLFTILCFIAYAVNLVFPLMQAFDIRFGMETYSYGFGHPAPFSMVVILFSVMMVFFSLLQKTKMPYIYLTLNLLLIVTAGRSTAIGIYLCFFLLLLILPHIKRLPVSIFITLGIFLLWFSWDRISNQFGAENTEARGILLRTSVDIAKDYFPFGAGLGMFGSNASRLDYSPLYNEYHLSHVWGLSELNPAFITDSYWAMIIGETGFLGVILLIALFVITVLAIIRYTSGNFKLKLIVVFPFIYALFTSPVDTLLASGSIVSVMLVVLYMITLSKEAASEQQERRTIGGKNDVQNR